MEYTIIIILVIALAGVILYKNKQAPQIIDNVSDEVIELIIKNKSLIVGKSYDELPVSVRLKINKETYAKISGILLDSALETIKKGK